MVTAMVMVMVMVIRIMKTGKGFSSKSRKASNENKQSLPSFRISNPGRFIIAVVFGLSLSAICAAQAVSITLTRKASEISLAMPFANGLASEARAANLFGKGAKNPQSIAKSAQRQKALAQQAFAEEAFVPKAHAILAMAAKTPEERQAILKAASVTNRRDLLLLGLVLEEELAANNYPRAIATFDRILRVHPDQSDKLFPALLGALTAEETLPNFAELLNGSSPWHNQFLGYAVKTPGIRPNLAKLRLMRDIGDENFDKTLINGLAADKQDQTAFSIFTKVTKARGPQNSWVSEYAPFDWRLEDSAGKRALADKKGETLDIHVRSGKGGIIAERWIANPNGALTIMVDHRLAPVDQVRDVQLQLSCALQSADLPFYSERFVKGKNSFAITNVPMGAGCGFIRIAIHARAWSGRSALRGTINSLRITPQR